MHTTLFRFHSTPYVEEYSTAEVQNIGEAEDEEEAIPSDQAKRTTHKQRKQFITPRLVAALDNAGLSDAKAIHVIIATVIALGHTIEDLVISRSSIRSARTDYRFEEAENIRAEFAQNVNLF